MRTNYKELLLRTLCGRLSGIVILSPWYPWCGCHLEWHFFFCMCMKVAIAYDLNLKLIQKITTVYVYISTNFLQVCYKV